MQAQRFLIPAKSVSWAPFASGELNRTDAVLNSASVLPGETQPLGLFRPISDMGGSSAAACCTASVSVLGAE